MIYTDYDVAVIGAGMAGSTTAAFLSEFRRVALIEAEPVAGYHTTGRSAALWLQNYGPQDVRTLSRLSRPFYEKPPAGFSEFPLIKRRSVLLVATPSQLPELEAAIAIGSGLRRATIEEAHALVPALRAGYLGGAALEDDAFDMDVAAIHQGFLRMLRANGGTIALRSRADRIEKTSAGVGDRDDGTGKIQGACLGQRSGRVG